MAKAETAAQRRRKLMEEHNLKKVELYVPESIKAELKKAEEALRAGSGIRILPPVQHTKYLTTSDGAKAMTTVTPWTVRTLFEEFEKSDLLPQEDIKLELVEGVSPSLEVSYEDLDRKAVLVVEGEQILVSILVCPVADVADSKELNETLLKTHKFLPLSTIGITTINGQDYYELFGALSSRSLLNSVATEIIALADNYEEVVSAFVELTEAA